MRAVIVPEQWISLYSQTVRQEFPNSCLFLSFPDLHNTSAKNFLKSIKHLLSRSDLTSAAIVLPLHYASAKKLKYWPEIYLTTNTGIVVTSVYFADQWEDCVPLIKTLVSGNQQKQLWNATCQYQPPYTYSFELWVEAGAKSIHPGDYFKDEFLQELNAMHGHWIYWGHADHKKLRGYNHINSKELLAHKPAGPLSSTLWFCCSTLRSNGNKSIALDWYLSGATRCLLASAVEVNTAANHFLAKAWLDAALNAKDKSIAGIIHFLLAKDESVITETLKQYRLLGSPWIQFGT